MSYKKEMRKTIVLIVILIITFFIGYYAMGQQNITKRTVTLDSLSMRQDTLWFTDGNGSIAYFRTKNDSLYLGDKSGEKTIGKLATGGVPAGSTGDIQINYAGSFGVTSYLNTSNVYIDDDYNIGFGYNVFGSIAGGVGNAAFSTSALASLTSGFYNSGIGAASLMFTTIGSNNIGLGFYSGRYNTTQSNRLYINSLDRTDIEGDTTLSIIYGHQAASIDDQKLYLNADVNIKGSLTVGGGAKIDSSMTFTDAIQSYNNSRYEASAYLAPDSVITTSITTSWTFLGAGQNNKFTQLENIGFSFNGDTLLFTQAVADLRDSVQFHCAYSSISSCSDNNIDVFTGIFVKHTGGAYIERFQLTRGARTQASGTYYSGPTCSLMPLWLKDGDKIQIRSKGNTSSTLSTKYFGIYLYEE